MRQCIIAAVLQKSNYVIRVILLAIAVAAVSVSVARSEELFSYFSKGDQPKQADLLISPCTQDELAECISHSLSCDESTFYEPELTIIVGKVKQIVSKLLIASNEGWAHGTLLLSGGATAEPLDILSLHIDANEMDGGWILTLGIMNGDVFFDALTEKSSEGAAIEVGGEKFALAPNSGDGSKLMALKEACAKFRN